MREDGVLILLALRSVFVDASFVDQGANDGQAAWKVLKKVFAVGGKASFSLGDGKAFGECF